MSEVRPTPCESCPYRRDVPSGVWAPEEYAKLLPFDRPTAEQPIGGFLCHTAPGSWCHGWAVVHTTRGNEFDLLALRLQPCRVPAAAVPLFGSGREAAEHGLRDVKRPKARAVKAVARLLGKSKRLRKENPL